VIPLAKSKTERSEWVPQYLTLNQIMDAVAAENKSPKWVENSLKAPVQRVSKEGKTYTEGASGITEYEVALWRKEHSGEVVRIPELEKLGLQPIDQYVRFPGKYEDETLGATTKAAYAIGPNTITCKKEAKGKDKMKTIIHEGLHKAYFNLSMFEPDTEVKYSNLAEFETNRNAQRENLERNEAMGRNLNEMFSNATEARDRRTITEAISYSRGSRHSGKKIEKTLLNAPNYAEARTGNMDSDRERLMR